MAFAADAFLLDTVAGHSSPAPHSKRYNAALGARARRNERKQLVDSVLARAARQKSGRRVVCLHLRRWTTPHFSRWRTHMTRITARRAGLALALFLTALLAACDSSATAPKDSAITLSRNSGGKDDPASHDKNDDKAKDRER